MTSPFLSSFFSDLLHSALTLYCLAKNPTAQQQLRDEINRVWDGEEELTPAHFIQMKMLSGSLKEAQRLYPTAPFNARVLKQDLILSGYDVPQGVSLRHIVNIYVLSLYVAYVSPLYHIDIVVGCFATYISVTEQ